jgi:hypothetical protein
MSVFGGESLYTQVSHCHPRHRVHLSPASIYTHTAIGARSRHTIGRTRRWLAEQWGLPVKHINHLGTQYTGVWGRLRDVIDSPLDHRSLPHEFESRRRHSWTVFHLWLRFITFGDRSAHLAYNVHKSGRKTSIIAIQMCQGQMLFYGVNHTSVSVEQFLSDNIHIWWIAPKHLF